MRPRMIPASVLRAIRSRYCLLVSGALLLSASTAFAQVITGRLHGTVRLEASEPAGNVAVTILGTALLGERSTTSDARGRFAFLSLPAGNYTVALRRIGYAPVRVTDVVVRLGTATLLDDVRLTNQAQQLAEVVVSGARPIIDLATPAAATVFDSSQFRVLPTGRDYSSLLALTPQGSPSPYGDGTTFGGATGYDNAYFIDGINTTNPLSADGGIKLPFNFIKEVQIVTGGYEAEYGRSQGAVVNIVTNSGGNEFHGEGVAFFTGNDLRASPRSGLAERPAAKFSHYDVGFGMGGPLKRDRVWFYAAYNPLFEDKDATFSGLGPRRDRLVRHLFAGKLSWRPQSATDVTVSVLGDPTARAAVEGAEAYPAPLATVTGPGVVSGDFRDGGWAVALQVRRQAGNRFLLSGSVSHLVNVHLHAGKGGSDDAMAIARVDDYVTATSFGNFGRFIQANTARDALEGSATISGMSHTFKAGASFERNEMSRFVYRHSFVTRSSASVWDWSTAHQLNGGGSASVPAAYVQDSWEISTRLRANVGLRWEGQFLNDGTASILRIPDEISPRIGIVFQPSASGSQKVSVSAGRFYEQMPLYAVGQLASGFTDLAGSYPQNPLSSRAGGTETETDYPRMSVDKSLRGQGYDELTMGYEARVGGSHVFGVRGVVRRLSWALTTAFADTTNPVDLRIGNPGRGDLAFLPRATRRYSGLELTVERAQRGRLNYRGSYVLSRSFGNVPGEFDSDARIPASHTTSTQAWPVWWKNATGHLPSDRRHLLKLSGSWRMRDDLTIGTAAFLATGAPLSEFGIAPFGFWQAFVRARGTAGRTPALWTADMRATYDLPRVTAGWRARLLLDVQNVGNQRRAIDFEQLHYFDAARTVVNPNFLSINRYQAPLTARVGMVVGF